MLLKAECQKSFTTIDGQDCHNAMETIKYTKILLSVCPCIEVFPELADDTTECPTCWGAQALECMRMREGSLQIQSWSWATLRANIESLDRPDCANLEMNHLPWKLLLSSRPM